MLAKEEQRTFENTENTMMHKIRAAKKDGVNVEKLKQDMSKMKITEVIGMRRLR